MNDLRKSIVKILISLFVFCLIVLSNSHLLFACDNNWIEVANTINEKQFIDINSIKYNKNGWLSVLVKYSEANPDNQEVINANSYLMAIDCEKRLYSKLPVGGEFKQVKNWTEPISNKLIKKTILSSCSY